MQRRTKKIFAWSSICVGTLLMGFPLAAVFNSQINAITLITGILGLIIMVNGFRFLQRIDQPWKPRSLPKKRTRRKRR